MMLCDADFDELFPWTTPVKPPIPVTEKPVRADAIRPITGKTHEAGLARWEDDGGKTRVKHKAGTPRETGIVAIDIWLRMRDYAKLDAQG